MDVMKMLRELRAQRDQLEEAIITLERLARGQGKRRGRPPLWMKQSAKEPASINTVPRKRKAFSAETRKRMAEAQKRRWATRTA